MKRKTLFDEVMTYFEHHMPMPETELEYENSYQLLVAVILSAQCTDKRVNQTTPAFFAAFPDAPSLANATFDEVQPYIKSISYPNNKTKHLIGMAQMLVNEFDNEVPADVEKLQKLPGVGRKTANVVASVVFDKGTFPVDTHVFRVTQRIGLVDEAKTPLQVEKQMLEYTPEHMRNKMHHWLILHGRYTCLARKPKCQKCGLQKLCAYYQSQKAGN